MLVQLPEKLGLVNVPRQRSPSRPTTPLVSSGVPLSMPSFMRSQLALPEPNVPIVKTSPSGRINKLCATALLQDEENEELQLEDEQLDENELDELLKDELLELQLLEEENELELELDENEDELELQLEKDELELENEDEDDELELENELLEEHELELLKDDEQDEKLEEHDEDEELEQTKNSILVIVPTGASMSEIRLISKLFDQSILTGGLVPPGEAGI